MSSEPKFPSEVEFAAFLVYSPRGTSEVSRRSQRVMRRVKLDTEQFARDHLTRRMKQDLPTGILEKFFSSSTTLVPAPKSAPLKDPHSRWAARGLCEAFVADGLGARVLHSLERVRPVQKSATAAIGQRPTVLEHYESMIAWPDLAAGDSITIVDDVISRGRMALAAVARVQNMFPEAMVRVFAVLRTMGLVPEVERILEPCEGTISWDGVDADRNL